MYETMTDVFRAYANTRRYGMTTRRRATYVRVVHMRANSATVEILRAHPEQGYPVVAYRRHFDI